MKRLRYLLEALALKAVLTLLGWLPVETASNLGGFLARGIGPLLSASARARRNLRLVFPEMDAAGVESMVTFASLPNEAEVVAEAVKAQFLRGSQYLLPTEETIEVAEALAAAQVHVSLRGTSLRVTPHLYNNQSDLDALFRVLEQSLA